MLRTGVRREEVTAGLKAELSITHAEAASAVTYAEEWLAQARR
jgi:hypothetical protein